jgi:hypothetical protein
MASMVIRLLVHLITCCESARTWQGPIKFPSAYPTSLPSQKSPPTHSHTLTSSPSTIQTIMIMTHHSAFPPMPLLPITSPSTISSCHNLPLRPTDIFICSYPKSGTTWTQHIVLTLLLADRKYQAAADDDDIAGCATNKNDQQKKDISYNHVSDYAPFYEVDAHWEQPVEQQQDTSSSSKRLLAAWIRKNHDRLGRRVFNTHLRWDMLPKRREVTLDNDSDSNGNQDGQTAEKVSDGSSINEQQRPQCGKFIYITRNQMDVVASFYHHLSNQKEGTYTESFVTFVHDWMDGMKIPFGSSLYHLLSFAVGFADNSYARGDGDLDQRSSSSINSNNNNSSVIHDDDNQPLLLLSYENMKSNLRASILRIISFLNLINIPMDVLDTEILPSFTFHVMKDNIEKFQPKSVGWLNGFQFLRRGVSGDGRMLMMMNDRDGGGSNNDNDDGEEEEGSSKLMDEYNDWIKREEYRSKIENILHGPSLKECREVFLSVV